ncbi:MAG TPA: GAF domain-containing protein, partial [Candidatus Cybelea sp.]|nr:GAF domain-containing protein [Candidatus Cybelea sp.]
VIAVFVLVEWALGGWLSTASHAANLVVAGGLALTLGLSMHQIHHRVDNFVDRAFFSKRRRDQDAILAFSREAAYVTDREVLLERTEEVLLAHADASSVAILVDDHRGRYGEVSENDSAVLALRAHHAVLDLHGLSTAIAGDYAFPMVSRGRVLGVLVLGPKRSHESYAPDELETILRLAHAVGSALDVLVQNGAADPMLARLDAICEAQANMTEALAALSAVLTDGRRRAFTEDPA